MRWWLLGWLVILLTLTSLTTARAPWDSEILHSWRELDYEWPSASVKAAYLANGSFVPSNCALAGVKVYRGDVFVTVPRWRAGVPATLARVTEEGLLRPWPSWSANRIGDCAALQYVQSMEVLPQLAQMWIIDTGRVDTFGAKPRSLCPPKIVVADLETGAFLSSYNFSNDVVSWERNFLNDLVIDPLRRVAFISNPAEVSLVVYDDSARRAWKFRHPSMNATQSAFKVNGAMFNNTTPIDGVALSPDWSTLFYCALAATKLYSVPTAVLRDHEATTADFNRLYRVVGNKQAQTDGMVMSQEGLYYGAVSSSTVMRWAVNTDLVKQNASYQNVILKTQRLIRQSSDALHWPDTFAIDEAGFLYFTSNRLDDFFEGQLDFAQGDPNFRIWKLNVGEQGYLARFTASAGVKTLPDRRGFVLLPTLVLVLLWEL